MRGCRCPPKMDVKSWPLHSPAAWPWTSPLTSLRRHRTRGGSRPQGCAQDDTAVPGSRQHRVGTRHGPSSSSKPAAAGFTSLPEAGHVLDTFMAASPQLPSSLAGGPPGQGLGGGCHAQTPPLISLRTHLVVALGQAPSGSGGLVTSCPRASVSPQAGLPPPRAALCPCSRGPDQQGRCAPSNQ